MVGISLPKLSFILFLIFSFIASFNLDSSTLSDTFGSSVSSFCAPSSLSSSTFFWASSNTLYILILESIFFKSAGPKSKVWISTLFLIWSYTVCDIHIPPGSAKGSSLEAIFTPSPNISFSVSTTSPRCIPIRSKIFSFSFISLL